MVEECRLGFECFGQTPLVYTETAVRSRSRKESGAGREQIQTRRGLGEDMDGGMMRQVCAGGPYKGYMTGELLKGCVVNAQVYTCRQGGLLYNVAESYWFIACSDFNFIHQVSTEPSRIHLHLLVACSEWNLITEKRLKGQNARKWAET